jgi:hypothetical protein
MKKLILALALASSFPAFAQTSANVPGNNNNLLQSSTQANATGGQGGQGGAGGNANALSQGSQANSGGNSMSSTYDRAASSAIAPALASGGRTCLGSKSAAAQFLVFGGSAGSTVPDEECDIREDALTIAALGFPQVGIAIMCSKPRVAAAMDLRGLKCPTKE